MTRPALLACALALASVAPAFAQTAAVERKEVGNRITENVPAIPAELIDRLNRYQNTRGASVAGWTGDGCLLVSRHIASARRGACASS